MICVIRVINSITYFISKSEVQVQVQVSDRHIQKIIYICYFYRQITRPFFIVLKKFCYVLSKKNKFSQFLTLIISWSFSLKTSSPSLESINNFRLYFCCKASPSAEDTSECLLSAFVS